MCIILGLQSYGRAGSHILSGNVLETRAMDELIPDWKEDPDCPIKVG